MRRVGASLLGAALIGALIAPAAAFAVVPGAVDDNIGTAEDTVATGNVLANDVAMVRVVSPVALDHAGGSLAVAVDGAYTFTPTAEWSGGPITTTYWADSDETVNGNELLAYIRVTVTAVNDVPVASDQAVDVVFNTAKAITLVATDVESGTLDYAVVDAPQHGQLTGTGADRTYTPATGYTGADSFTFKANDGEADSNTATVTITVAADEVPPTVAVPAVAFGTGRVNEGAPLTVTWSATDTGVGVAGYVVESRIGTGAWTQIYAGTGTSLNRSHPFGQDLRWRVKAKDANDNWSAWTESAVRKLTAYQGASPVAFTGTWAKVTSAGSSGTGYRYTTTSGKKAKLTFTGLGVLVVAPKLSTAGYARVKFDTASSTRVNLRASSTSLGVIVKSKMWGASGTHTVQIWNDQGGRRTTFDAFVVLR